MEKSREDTGEILQLFPKNIEEVLKMFRAF